MQPLTPDPERQISKANMIARFDADKRKRTPREVE
jgi:hypothetical protein